MRVESMAGSRALLVFAATYLVIFAAGGIQLPLTTIAMVNVGLSMSDAGVMWAARSLLGVIGPTLWGLCADRVGDSRPFAIASLVLGSAILLALSMTTTALPAIVLFGLYGLLCAPSGSLVDGMVLTALGDARHRFGRWRMWGTIGFGVTAFGSAMLVDRHVIAPVPSVLFPACAFLTGLGALFLLFAPRLPRPSLTRLRDVLPVVRRPDMLALFFTSAILWCSHVAYTSFLTPLALARGLPEWAVGGSLAAAIVVEALMLRFSGWFFVRFGGRRVMLVACALTIVRWVSTAFATSPVPFIALNALHGVTFGLFFGTLVAVVAERTPIEMRQAAQGTIGGAAFGLGGAVGSLAVGVLIEHTDATTTWLAMAGVATVGLLVAFRGLR